MNKGDTVYFARVNHRVGIYDLCELHVRTVYEKCFVGVDADSKQAFLISNDDIGEYVFYDRFSALEVLQREENNKGDDL